MTDGSICRAYSASPPQGVVTASTVKWFGEAESDGTGGSGDLANPGPHHFDTNLGIIRGGSAEANAVQVARKANQLCEKKEMLLGSKEQGRFNL